MKTTKREQQNIIRVNQLLLKRHRLPAEKTFTPEIDRLLQEFAQMQEDKIK